MNNKDRKPKKTAHELILKMRDEKGITFRYTSEKDAETYLDDINNFLRTASYRQNYQKYLNGDHKGKYIDLDFAYLQELSTIDMHFRFIISKMCLDIEHALKVTLVRDISMDSSTDGYDIVDHFLTEYPYIIGKLESISSSPFTGNLFNKYFTVHQVFHPKKGKGESKIISYDDCPAWVLCELLTFGDFINFYTYYYKNRNPHMIPASIINLVKNLRNGAAHNSCLLANQQQATSFPPRILKDAVKQIKGISTSQRQKKLSCRPILEFTALIYTYNMVVTEKVRNHRIEELKWLFFTRIPEKKGFFIKNDLLKSNYQFTCKLITGIFH